MIHRHLQQQPDARIEQQPSAAIVDILERGDLNHWKPIAAAIAREPFGEFADRVLRLVDAYPMYGTSPLWRRWIDHCRTRAEGAQRPARMLNLATLRREQGLTQVELADRLGISQSDLSKLERRRDVRLSTLRAYARALGGTLGVFFTSAVRRAELRVGHPKK